MYDRETDKDTERERERERYRQTVFLTSIVWVALICRSKMWLLEVKLSTVLYFVNGIQVFPA
jgi:hypothetical protein